MSISSVAVLSFVVGVAMVLAWALTQRDVALMGRASSRLGYIFVALYLGLFAVALTIWRGAEGFGIASIVFGMPWSTLCALVLNELFNVRNGVFGTSWETTITTLSMFFVGLNTVIIYNVGRRIGASLAAGQRR